MVRARAVLCGEGRQPAATRFLTRRFLLQCQAEREAGRKFNWVIETAPGGELIGAIGLGINTFRAGLGYVLARPFWSHGYATEAGHAVVDWAIVQPEIFRVWAVCDIDNPASRRVLEKLGLTYEGILHRWIVHPNISPEPRDCHCFARCR